MCTLDRLPASLQVGVHARVRQLRAQGVEPERVLIAMKSLVVEALQLAPLGSGWHRATVATAGELLIDQVVRWSIDAYFSE
jgi:hypothetical protein